MSYDARLLFFRGITMKLRILLLLSAALALGLAHGAGAAEARPATKAVTVNGKAISQAKVEFAVKQRVAQGQPDNEQLRRGILDLLVNQELLAQEAERRGLLKGADAQIQLELVRQEFTANVAVADHMKSHPIKDEAARAEYEKIKSQRGDREYRARHIMVETETGAMDIVARLQKGEKFEDLAKQSKDPGSKDRGGDLDWAPRSTYVPPFAEALVKLEKGKFTDKPVQTQYGWHVIRLDDVRSAPTLPYEQVRQQILSQLQQQEVQKFLTELRAKAKIE